MELYFVNHHFISTLFLLRMKVAKETQRLFFLGKQLKESRSVNIPKQVVVEVCDNLKLNEEVDCREENTGGGNHVRRG